MMRKVLFACMFVCMTVMSVSACSVPVFRYALERWVQDLYPIYVFCDGAPEGASLEKVQSLAQKGAKIIDPDGLVDGVTADGNTNYVVMMFDVNKQLKGMEKHIWDSRKGDEMPYVCVRFPVASRVANNLWEGALSKVPADSLFDSPQRSEIASRLIDGESVTWVIVSSGNKKKDKQAVKAVEAGLDSSRSILKLPEMEAADIQEYLTPSRPEVRMEFSYRIIDGDDPAERFFVKMLRTTEPMLERMKGEPLVFPIFGRGRALNAMAGKGITIDNIIEANAYLTGPCACTVKAENPGTDLLFTAEWDDRVVKVVEDEPMPPLQGLEAFMQQQEKNR
ncbi:MAG: hypothetical protein ACLFSB_12425 [Chitinispirillaceae bacterium]